MFLIVCVCCMHHPHQGKFLVSENLSDNKSHCDCDSDLGYVLTCGNIALESPVVSSFFGEEVNEM